MQPKSGCQLTDDTRMNHLVRNRLRDLENWADSTFVIRKIKAEARFDTHNEQSVMPVSHVIKQTSVITFVKVLYQNNKSCFTADHQSRHYTRKGLNRNSTLYDLDEPWLWWQGPHVCVCVGHVPRITSQLSSVKIMPNTRARRSKMYWSHCSVFRTAHHWAVWVKQTLSSGQGYRTIRNTSVWSCLKLWTARGTSLNVPLKAHE